MILSPPGPAPTQKPRKTRSGCAIVLATHRAEIVFAGRPVRRWMKEFFGRPPRANELPGQLCRWLEKTGAGRAGRLHVSRRAKKELLVTRERRCENEIVALFFQVNRIGPNASRKQRPLTRRETEVLAWLARGKTNSEIAALLEIQPATVGKHLEHIYPKLGVENRTSAASFAGVQGAALS